MPQPHSAPAKLPLTVQLCPKCAQPMRLVSLEPNERYNNLDSLTFACDCGGTICVTVARVD
jgi:hypothetical protein